MAGFKTIYTRDGTPLTDIRAAVTRSWLLKDIGEATFHIDTSSVKCKKEYLEYGNYILVKHDSLPAWVGIIDTPRIWHNGYVEVHAYEPAMLLKYRHPPLGYKVTDTPGGKFESLITQANNQGDTLLRVGTVADGGESIEEEFTGEISGHIKDLCERYLMEWKTYPLIDTNGRLTIGIDFVSVVGIQTDAELTQGKNILFGDTPLEESGELINSVEAVAEVPDVAINSYVYSVGAAYGLRAKRVTFQGLGADALPSLAQNAVEKQAEASVSTPLTVANVGRLFANIDIGNVLKYNYKNIGFSGGGLGSSRSVRIAGFRYNEVGDTCELFVENAA